jgi:uncharacterized protein YktB (UPF0637 family)
MARLKVEISGVRKDAIRYILERVQDVLKAEEVATATIEKNESEQP